MRRWLLLPTALLTLEALEVGAQQPGTPGREGGLGIQLRECSRARGCRNRRASLTLDANWRWVREAAGTRSCFSMVDGWHQELCPDPQSCAQHCALEGVLTSEYKDGYGVRPAPNGVELRYGTKAFWGWSFGSRLFVLDGARYKLFQLLNREISMDVDASRLPCGVTGAVRLVSMDADGGAVASGGANRAGARYGTGYCDAQCPRDVMFHSGQVNMLNWTIANGTTKGRYGSCCSEVDVWEANRFATTLTSHPCNATGPQPCEGAACGAGTDRYAGICDRDGCDFNPHRLGETHFYGPGRDFEVDSSRPFTVVTQFITDNGTDSGELSEIRRFYIQDGEVIANAEAIALGPDVGNSLHDDFCAAEKAVFADQDENAEKGRFRQMGEALRRGMVLTLSIVDDAEFHMRWLDSTYPAEQDPEIPGTVRGPCPAGNASSPEYLRRHHASAFVRFTNIAVGELGSTTRAHRRLSPTEYI